MQTAPIPRSSDHRHQCSWCARFYGEFSDQDCAAGHKFERCCLECEQEQPSRKDLFRPHQHKCERCGELYGSFDASTCGNIGKHVVSIHEGPHLDSFLNPPDPHRG